MPDTSQTTRRGAAARPTPAGSRPARGRVWWRPLLALLVALVVGAAGAAPSPAEPADEAGQVVRTAAAAPPAQAVQEPTKDGATYAPLDLGVSIFSLWRDWPYVNELFDLAEQTGTRWVRIDMGWCTLEEYGKGVISTWYQDRLDYTVQLARSKGMQVLVMVGCAPTWAGGTDFHDLPTNAAEYRRVMRYLSKRYVGYVSAWEIWNEPNCIDGCGTGTAAQFAPVLKAGFRGVRDGDPTALVVAGGLSGNDANFLIGLYRAGAKGFFDVVATHPYLAPTTAGPYAAGTDHYSMVSVENIHAVMEYWGDGQLPIWFTEYGWSTAPKGSDRPGVTAAKQADYLTKSTTMLRARYPYVTKAFWYVMRDRDDSTAYENAFGLLRLDGTPKASYRAFTASVATLAPAVAAAEGD